MLSDRKADKKLLKHKIKMSHRDKDQVTHLTMDRGDWQMKAREYGGAGNLNIQSQFNNQILVQVAVCKIVQSPDSSC